MKKLQFEVRKTEDSWKVSYKEKTCKHAIWKGMEGYRLWSMEGRKNEYGTNAFCLEFNYKTGLPSYVSETIGTLKGHKEIRHNITIL